MVRGKGGGREREEGGRGTTSEMVRRWRGGKGGGMEREEETGEQHGAEQQAGSGIVQ